MKLRFLFLNFDIVKLTILENYDIIRGGGSRYAPPIGLFFWAELIKMIWGIFNVYREHKKC